MRILKEVVSSRLFPLWSSDWLWPHFGVSRTSHKYPARVMTVKSNWFSTPALTSSPLLGQLCRETEKWKSSLSLCHPLVKTRVLRPTCRRMEQFREETRLQMHLRRTTWVVIWQDNTLFPWTRSLKRVMDYLSLVFFVRINVNMSWNTWTSTKHCVRDLNRWWIESVVLKV